MQQFSGDATENHHLLISHASRVFRLQDQRRFLIPASVNIDPQGQVRLRFPPMANKASTYPPAKAGRAGVLTGEARTAGRASALLDTRVVYCGDRLEQLPNLTDRCVGLICIDPPIAG